MNSHYGMNNMNQYGNIDVPSSIQNFPKHILERAVGLEKIPAFQQNIERARAAAIMNGFSLDGINQMGGNQNPDDDMTLSPIQKEPEPEHVSNNTYNENVCYHIVLDCEFGSRNKLHERSGGIIGKFRQNTGNKLPVLFSYNEAVRVAKRFSKIAAEKGSLEGKSYPVFGSVILVLDVSSLQRENHGEIHNANGARDYANLNANNELTVYNVNNERRGVLSNDGFVKAKILGAHYECCLDMSEHVGFCLHNLNPKLESKDVVLLKKIYEHSKVNDTEGSYYAFTVNDVQTGGYKFRTF